MCECMCYCERVCGLREGGGTEGRERESFTVELCTFQSFSNEVQSHSQCLTSLNDMSHDLIDNHHSNDDTHDLQDTMNDLNQRWKKMMQRYVP